MLPFPVGDNSSPEFRKAVALKWGAILEACARAGLLPGEDHNSPENVHAAISAVGLVFFDMAEAYREDPNDLLDGIAEAGGAGEFKVDEADREEVSAALDALSL